MRTAAATCALSTPMIVMLVLIMACGPLHATPASTGAARPTSTYSASSTDLADGVKIYLRNNTGWFKPVELYVINPGDSEGKLISKFLLPWQRFRLRVPTGTKIWIMSDRELENFNKEGTLPALPADLTVRVSDADELYNLFP